MTLEQFEKNLKEKLAAITDEELKDSLRRAGAKFEESESEADYKNSLKNDY